VKIPRNELYARSGGYCEKCGGSLGDNWAAHHRLLRKHGGKDEIVNLLALHHECHNLGTNSVHLNPAKSYEAGYLVKSWDNPATMPILLPDGKRKCLTEDGKYCEHDH
jgi:hypothetical protein